MESWARADPADLPTRLEEVEIIFERLDLIALFELLLAKCSVHDRKALSYVGGIRLSSDDIGFPAPYASTEHYMLADGGKMMTRDPGDALWANVFDVLSRQHMMRHKREESLHLENLSMDRKGDMLELTLGAAQCILDMDGAAPQLPAWELQRCLHCARLLIEDLAS
jgi:hypothetical protein